MRREKMPKPRDPSKLFWAPPAMVPCSKFSNAPPAVPDEDVVRLIESAFGVEPWAEFEGWKVLCTGWKTSMISIDAGHKWVVRPVEPNHPLSGVGVFVVPMPGFCCVVRRGEWFNSDFRQFQVGYGVDFVRSGWKDPYQLLSNAMGVTARLTLEAMRGAAVFTPGPPQGAILTWDQRKLSEPSRFYLEPELYIKEKYGLDRYTVEIEKDLLWRLYGVEPL